jgi:hypothetical protein
MGGLHTSLDEVSALATGEDDSLIPFSTHHYHLIFMNMIVIIIIILILILIIPAPP